MKRRGYTLIEMLVVVAIILVVTGIGGLSIIKAMRRNDYNEMATVIPKAIAVETNKAFEEGSEKTITLDLDSKSIETGGTEKFLPENYTYSVYSVTRDSDGNIDGGGTSSKLTGSHSDIEFEIDDDGKINSVYFDGDETDSVSGFNSKYHPSILVENDGEPFCRIDIISSLYITPKIKVYKPDGADSTTDDMQDPDKWVLDSRI
jgi:prepilin-type N-terminal cleavage/methylation domain-containing protein